MNKLILTTVIYELSRVDSILQIALQRLYLLESSWNSRKFWLRKYHTFDRLN